MSYRLDVLNDKDFEDLCKDLLDADLKISFQNFKKGRDKGVDLRYAYNVENEIIVQAKHYPKSTFSNLKIELKKEKVKMDILSPSPKRYILMTSYALSVGQADQVVAAMEPYIKSSQDVYGKDRIMAMISSYHLIEEKYYKLWITSTNVLKNILHNATKSRSEFFKEKILKKVSLYVPTQNFQLAVEKLKENHFIIITGDPGIGKTTISYLLICDLMAHGYELIHVDDKLKDAEELLSSDVKKKQVVFFDDFFGANLSEIINPRNSESKIIGFIERIQATPNKFMVLTTRTTILNQAQHNFEKFKRSQLADASKYEIEIKAYSKLDKAKMLYNHLYHSGISPDQHDVFFQSKNYLKIINHKNYFPRLIEFITSANQLKNIPFNTTEAFIFQSLTNPSEIWNHAYSQQLVDEDQFLLTTLFSLGGYNVNGLILETAFQNRYDYEIKENGYRRKANTYNYSIKKLLDGFITGKKDIDTNQITFSFLNPSIGDFLFNYLRAKPDEQKRIFFAAKYFIQLTKYFSTYDIKVLKLSPPQQEEYYKWFKENSILTRNIDSKSSSDKITILYVYLSIFDTWVTEEVLIEILKRINLKETLSCDYYELTFILEFLNEYPSTKIFVQKNWIPIFTEAFKSAIDSVSFTNIVKLLGNYEITPSIWSSNEIFISKVGSKINDTFLDGNDFDLDSNRDEILHPENNSAQIVRNMIEEQFFSFLEECNLTELHDRLINNLDIDEDKIARRFLINSEYDVEADGYDPVSINSDEKPFDEIREIEHLFER